MATWPPAMKIRPPRVNAVAPVTGAGRWPTTDARWVARLTRWMTRLGPADGLAAEHVDLAAGPRDGRVPDRHGQPGHRVEGRPVGRGEHRPVVGGAVVAADQVGRAAQGHRGQVRARPGKLAGHGGGATVPQRLHGRQAGRHAAAEQVRLPAEHRAGRVVAGRRQVPGVRGTAGHRVELGDGAGGDGPLVQAPDDQQVAAAGQHDLAGDPRRKLVGRGGDLHGQRHHGAGRGSRLVRAGGGCGGTVRGRPRAGRAGGQQAEAPARGQEGQPPPWGAARETSCPASGHGGALLIW